MSIVSDARSALPSSMDASVILMPPAIGDKPIGPKETHWQFFVPVLSEIKLFSLRTLVGHSFPATLMLLLYDAVPTESDCYFSL